jgi:hypothetical protein
MAERLTPEEIRAWAEKSRAASGVPPKIEDEATLVRLARLAFADAEDAGERGMTTRSGSTSRPSRTRRGRQ